MLNIDESIKSLYKSDNFTGSLSFTINGVTYSEADVKMGSLTLTESLCSSDNLNLKSFEASTLKLTLIKGSGFNADDLIGEKIVISSNVSGASIPLGTFKIDSAKNTDDYLIDIDAYDNNKIFIDTVIDDWWNSKVTFPITLHDLLVSLCEYCGVSYSLPGSWTNSNIKVLQNAYFENQKASDVISMIQEISGCFFRCDRTGILKQVEVNTDHPWYTYPGDNTFPGNRTYPTNTGSNVKETITYDLLHEDPTIGTEIKSIDKIQVHPSDSEDDIGVVSGTGDNLYSISNNVLIYNKTTDELQEIADNVLSALKNTAYVPVTSEYQALPYLEVGDTVTIKTYGGQEATTLILHRELNGNGLCSDKIEIKGDGKRTNTSTQSPKTIVTVLNRRIHTLKNTLDELNSSFESIETTQKGTVASVTTYWLQTVEGSPPATTSPAWSTTPATFKQGYHIWQMTKTVYIDPERPVHYSVPVEITTPDVVSITPYYRLSASDKVLYDWLYPSDSTYPGDSTYPSDTWSGDWHTDCPDWAPGMWLWIKQLIKYTDGSERWTYPVVDGTYRNATATVTKYNTEIDQTNQRIDTKAEASTVTSYYNDLIGRIDQEKIDRSSEIEQTAKSINEKVTSVASAAVRGMNVYYKTSVSKESPDSDGYTYPGDSTMPGENTYPTLPITSDSAWSETEPQPTAGHYLWCKYHLTYFDETTQKEVTKDIIRLGKLESTAYNLAINNSASLTILDNSVSLNALRIETLDGNINEQSAKFLVAYNQITSEVSKKVGNDEIISKINQTPEEIKIQANKITLEGIITANNNFKVLKDGSIEAKNGKFSGELTFGVAPNTVVMKTSDDNDGATISGAGKIIIHSVNGVFIKSLNGDTKGSSNTLSMGIKDNSYIFSFANSVYGSSSTSTDADNTANLIKLTETSDHSRTILLKNNGYNSNYDYNDVYLTGSSSSNQISLRNHSKLAPSSTGNSLFMSSGSTGTSFTRIYNYRATSRSSTALAATLQLYSSYNNSGASNLDTSVSAKVYEADGSTLAANCEIWKDYDPSNPLNHFALTCRDGNGNISTGIAGTSDGVVRIYGASAAILYAGVNSTQLYISDGSKSHLVFNADSDYTYLDHDGNTSIRQGSNGVDIFYAGGWHSFKKVYRLSSSSGDHMVSDTYGEAGYKTEAYFYVLDYVHINS